MAKILAIDDELDMLILIKNRIGCTTTFKT